MGVTFVAFSPVTRGFLCGELQDVSTLHEKDIRRAMPRFSPENFTQNLKLLPPYLALAREVGCSPAQLALAWLLHRGDHIIPIPGTTSVPHLLDDLGASEVTLGTAVMAKLDDLISERTVAGNRYNEQSNREVDTEVFEP